MWCEHSHPTRRYVQQHTKKHFPTEYNCIHCGDKFHLKTMWENHFIEQCSICNKLIKGNIKSHQKRCKNTVYNRGRVESNFQNSKVLLRVLERRRHFSQVSTRQLSPKKTTSSGRL